MLTDGIFKSGNFTVEKFPILEPKLLRTNTIPTIVIIVTPETMYKTLLFNYLTKSYYEGIIIYVYHTENGNKRCTPDGESCEISSNFK